MRNLGFLLLILGIGSIVVHFMGREMRLLMWIDTWGENVAWAIRGGVAGLGLLLVLASGKKDKKK